MKNLVKVFMLSLVAMFTVESAQAGFIKGWKAKAKKRKSIRKSFKAAKKVCKKGKDKDFQKLVKFGKKAGIKITVGMDEWKQVNCDGKKFKMSRGDFKRNPGSASATGKKVAPSAR